MARLLTRAHTLGLEFDIEKKNEVFEQSLAAMAGVSDEVPLIKSKQWDGYYVAFTILTS